MSDTTESLLLRRALGRAHPEDYVDWAVDQLCRNVDGASLRILAGLSVRFDWDEIEPYFRVSKNSIAMFGCVVCLVAGCSSKARPPAVVTERPFGATVADPCRSLASRKFDLERIAQVHRAAGASLFVESLQPRPGHALSARSRILAIIKYIADLKPDKTYSIVVQYASIHSNCTFNGETASERTFFAATSPQLVTLDFPVAPVFANPSLARPIRLRFLLLEWIEPDLSIALASTPFVQYPRQD